MQSEPQLIPTGELVIIPFAADLLTVSVKIGGAGDDPYSYAPKSIAEPAILEFPSLSVYKAPKTVLNIVLSAKRFLKVSEFGSNPLSIATEPALRRNWVSEKFRSPALGGMIFLFTIVLKDDTSIFV